MPVATVSEDVSYAHLGWSQAYHSNKPLGAKWNAGMRLMREKDVDAVLIMGSDDIVNDAVIEYYRDARPEFGTLSQLYVFDSVSRKCVHLYRGRMGAGRIVSAKLMDTCDWAPWDPDKNKGLDRCVESSLGRAPTPVKSHLAKVMDIKSGTNIWSFEHLARNTRCERTDPAKALSHFGLTLDDIPVTV